MADSITMAELDPNIILDATKIQPPDPNTQTQGLVSMFSLAQAVKQQQAAETKQNMLKRIFSDPASVDTATGLPTPQATQKIMQVDPDMGIKLRDATLDSQVKRMQIAHSQTEAGKASFDFMATAAGAGYDAYTEARQNGKSEADAIAAGQAARNETVRNNGGVIGDDIAQGILSKPFDPPGARALASTSKEWTENQQRAKTDKIAQDRLDYQEKHGDQQHGAEMKRIDQAGSNKWQVLTDPKSQTQYRYNPETGESTSLDGKSPYSPSGAAKMASGQPPRSAAAAYIQSYMKEHPDATSDDISKAANRFNMGQSEGRTIGQRAGAADVASQEVDVFAKQALDASKAVDRTALKGVNTLIQAGETQASDPNLQKLLIATDALVNARARAISPSGSPHVSDQIEGRRLLSTLIGKEGYEAGVQQFLKEAQGVRQSTKASQTDFTGADKPSAKGTSGIAAPSSKAEYDALPSGAHYSKPGDPAGTYRVKP